MSENRYRTEHTSRMIGTVDTAKVVTFEVPRHPENYSARMLAIPDMSSAVADAFDEFGVGVAVDSSALAPISAGNRLCGPAVTLRYATIGGDVSSIRDSGTWGGGGDRDLYGIGRPGDVAVMDCSGSTTAAVMGALSARWAIKAGIAGCVVDGTIRDTESIAAAGLPVWSAGARPNSARYRYEVVEINGPATICGYLVHPGDYVVADVDGICIIPFDDIARVVDFCEAANAVEAAFIARIDAAASLESLVADLASASNPA